MQSRTTLSLNHRLAVNANNGGLFVSRGRGTHPTRTIDSHELIVVRSGRLAMFEDKRQFVLGRGDALLLWPHRLHGGAEPYSPDLSFFWLHFAVSRQSKNSRHQAPQNRIRQIVHLGSECQGVFELLLRFLDDQQRPGGGNALKRSLILSLILAELSEARHQPKHDATNDASSLPSRARELIATAGLDPSMRSALVAKRLDCNADYLARTFRAAFGHSLTHEIHTVRIRRARQLLTESRMGVKQISHECGFGDLAFFREVFRRHAGTTPAAFRRVRSAIHVNTA